MLNTFFCGFARFIRRVTHSCSFKKILIFKKQIKKFKTKHIKVHSYILFEGNEGKIKDADFGIEPATFMLGSLLSNHSATIAQD